jgi:lysophospholipase L1-like esterase
MRNGLRAFMKKTILVAFALVAIPAFAGNDKNYTYLALGDSIPFGMNILLMPPFSTQLPTPSEFIGYPETVAAAEHLLNSKKLVNASCPGESSGSFLNVTSPDFGCNSNHPNPPGTNPLFLLPFKTTVGLKADYTGAQMDFAVAELRSNKHIDMVTLSIGANDVFVCLNDPTCSLPSVLNPDPAVGSYAKNLQTILKGIRANYSGKLVLLMYYSPDPGLDTLAVAVNTAMQAVGSGFNVTFADGFAAFKMFGNDACQAGLLIRLPPGSPAPCDIHPSPLGRNVLATIVEIALHQ